jgi:asparagine synthase (glutamine-hydrolysing)
MCGIAGIWHRDGSPVDRLMLHSMTQAIRHRGPDGAGHYVHGSIALGHRRLKVIDLSAAAAQPMWLPDRSLCVVYNGEVHNYVELAAELRTAGVVLRGASDTEVVLWAYRLWGEDCFERFNGMWAAAFWEPARGRLLLSRDRFGIKPLLFSIRGARVAFASEAKPILAAFPEERRADWRQVSDFAAGGTPDSDECTFFEGIRSVPPAHFLRIDCDVVTTARYWRFEPGVETARSDSIEAFRALIEDAVRLRMRSDVKVGVSLSGGLDSSTIARLAARGATAPLECFSLRLDAARLDESRYASLVADDAARYRIHWVTPQPDDFLATTSALVWHHDSPMPIRGRYSQWHVLREAARHVTVILSGQGADEMLGGYSGFVLPYALDRLDPGLPASESRHRLPGELLRLCRVSSGVHRLLPRLILTALRQRLALPAAHALTPSWNSGPVSSHRYRGGELQRPSERPFASRLNNTLWAELRHAGLPEALHAEDAISMAFSLESRPPFLDHRLVELCFSLPYDRKIGKGWTKLLLREATAELLPEEVRWRRRKLGYPGDYESWLAGPIGCGVFRDVLLDPRTLQRGMLDGAWLRSRLGGPPLQAARWIRRNLQPAWALLTLELWCRLFLDADESMRPSASSATRGEAA